MLVEAVTIKQKILDQNSFYIHSCTFYNITSNSIIILKGMQMGFFLFKMSYFDAS